MHEVRFLLRAVGGGEDILRRRTSEELGLPRRLIIYSIVQPQQVSFLRPDGPGIVGQQVVGLLVQPRGNGLIRPACPHRQTIAGRVIILRQNLQRLLMERHGFIEKRRVPQPQGAVLLVAVKLPPQALRPLPQRFAVGHAQQLRHLFLCPALRQLRQHPQRQIQAHRRVHSVLPRRKDHLRRLAAEANQLLGVHPFLRFLRPGGIAGLHDGVLPCRAAAAARQQQRCQRAAQYSSYFLHPVPSL